MNIPVSTTERGKVSLGMSTPELKAATPEVAIEKSITQLEQEGRNTLLEAELSQPKVSSDQAVLSKESKESQSKSETVNARREEWKLETDPLWPLLLTWYPDSQLSTEEMIQQLMDLYQALLTNLMENTTGQNQYVQLTLLEQALSEALNRMWEHQLGDMAMLLKGYGTKDQVLEIKNEIYRMVTRQRLSKGDVQAFWNQGTGRSSVKHGNGLLPEGAATSKGSRTYHQTGPQGMIYQPAKGKGEMGREVVMQPAAKEHSFNTASSNTKEAKFQIGGTVNGEITSRDLKHANQLSKYLNSPNNVLTLEGVTGKSEEVQGVLASILQIQSREFAKSSGMGNTMANAIYDMVDRMIDRHFRRQETLPDEVGSQKQGKMQGGSFRARDAYGVYHYINNLYEKQGKPERTIGEGIRYAIEVFVKKRGDPATKKAGVTQENNGFFQYHQTNEPTFFWSDIKYGKLLIEKNWATFLAYTGMVRKKDVTLIPLDQSFWGSLIKPQDAELPPDFRYYVAIFAGVLCMGLGALLYLKMF